MMGNSNVEALSNPEVINLTLTSSKRKTTVSKQKWPPHIDGVRKKICFELPICVVKTY